MNGLQGAPLGTHEQFIGGSQSPASSRRRLHTGNFPLWLAPDQVRVITLNDDKALINYAQPIVAKLRANRVRMAADFNAPLFNSDKSRAGAKIANAEQGGARLRTSRLAGTLAPPTVATWKLAR